MGTAFFDDYTRMKIADIPGLIPGAHTGVASAMDSCVTWNGPRRLST